MAYEDDVKWANNYINSYNPNETVNYNDSRLTNIEAQRQNEASQLGNTYDNMINQSDNFYNNLINTQKDYMNKQINNQNANTEQAIKEINQQKDKTQRDYEKEQRGAYADYQKQIDRYGVEAEKRASLGLNNTGYAESSNVSMYNTWQNRVATARQSLQDSMLSYDNMIAQARLINNEKLAEIAYNYAKAQAQYALEGFQYKNTLIETKQTRLNELGTRYDTKYQNMLNQINNELSAKRAMFSEANSVVSNYNKWKQDQDQFEKQMAYNKERAAISDKQYQEQLAYTKERAAVSDKQYEEQLAYQKERAAVADKQYKEQQDYKKQRDAVADSQWQKEYNLSVSKANTSSSSGSKSTTSKSTTSKSTTSNVVNNTANNSKSILYNIGSTTASVVNGISSLVKNIISKK